MVPRRVPAATNPPVTGSGSLAWLRSLAALRSLLPDVAAATPPHPRAAPRMARVTGGTPVRFARYSGLAYTE